MVLESADQNASGGANSGAEGYRAARRQLIKAALAAVPAVLTITASQAQANHSGSGSHAMDVEQLNALGIMQDDGPLDEMGGAIDDSSQIDPFYE